MQRLTDVWQRVFWRWDVTLFLSSIGLFIIWPGMDLAVSGWFYQPQEGGFYVADWDLIRLIHALFAKVHILTALIFIALIVYFSRKGWYSSRKRVVYLLCALLLGPGLVVNVLLKDNSIGRARPNDVVEFGGSAAFTPVLYYSGYCERNCSFPSGHASAGFYFVALAWAMGRRYYLLFGILFGAALGLMRIAQGGHFASDVLFSFWVCYFVSLVLAARFGLSLDRAGFAMTPSSSQAPNPSEA